MLMPSSPFRVVLALCLVFSLFGVEAQNVDVDPKAVYTVTREFQPYLRVAVD